MRVRRKTTPTRDIHIHTHTHTLLQCRAHECQYLPKACMSDRRHAPITMHTCLRPSSAPQRNNIGDESAIFPSVCCHDAASRPGGKHACLDKGVMPECRASIHAAAPGHEVRPVGRPPGAVQGPFHEPRPRPGCNGGIYVLSPALPWARLLDCPFLGKCLHRQPPPTTPPQPRFFLGMGHKPTPT